MRNLVVTPPFLLACSSARLGLPFWHLSCLGSLRSSSEPGRKLFWLSRSRINQPRRRPRSLDRPLKPRREIFASRKHGRGGELRAFEWKRLDGCAHVATPRYMRILNRRLFDQSLMKASQSQSTQEVEGDAYDR
jgi:hypothetical protein